MPSPFPGIDPYLEQSRFWRGFHNGLIFAIQAYLNANLPPGYAANYEEQVVLLPLGQSIVPNVMVIEQRELLSSQASLLEIDLLRQGQHTIAAPKQTLQEDVWDGIVCLHRPWSRYHFDCWFCFWQKTLPLLTVPLLQEDGEIALDFASIYSQVYDLGPYHRLIDYAARLPVPASQEESDWADALLREKGLRQ